MMFKLASFTFLFLIGYWSACNNSPLKSSLKDYPKQIGDLTFDPSIDDVSFKICNEDRVIQHYSPYVSGISALYKGDKIELVKQITAVYVPTQDASQNGVITTRFIVNCSGETGWFRVEEMTDNYQPMVFNKKISNQMAAILSSLNGWKPMKIEGRIYDYYVYIAIKIKDGQIVKILP